MSQKTILSVGQCGPDHASLTRFFHQHFDVEILTADLPADALDVLRGRAVDLVLINRKLDADYTDGMNILRTIKADQKLSSIPVMIVSNFEEAQQAAVETGAVYGFGKAELSSPVVKERVENVLHK
ncbi:MAG: response regulator [Planctomycetaceae bacterium]|jgi:two-component system chemotaxis response regulator CheY